MKLRVTRRTRNILVLIVLIVQLCFCKEYLTAYRSVPHTERNAFWLDDWKKGCLDMYEHTMKNYIPAFALTGLILAILAVIPIRQETQAPEEQERKKELS